MTAPNLICPNLTLYFRIAFNCFECCALHAVTTHKPKFVRLISVTNRIFIEQFDPSLQ